MVGSRGGWEKRKSVKKKRGRKEEEPERKREMAEEREGKCQERGKDGEEKREETPQRSLVWLCNPMDCTSPGSTIHGIFQARILECVAISCPGYLPTQGRHWHLLH